MVEGNPCAAAKRAEVPNNPADLGTVFSKTPTVFLNVYPNPFSDEVNIDFSLADDMKVRVEILNLEGKNLSVVFDGNVKANELQTHQFRAGDLSSGMYFYRMITENGEIQNRKLVLVK